MCTSKRLEAIVSVTDINTTVADIGCDHGLTLINLCRQNKIKKGIACDIKKLPLSRAVHNIEKYGYESIIETRLSDGLSALMPYEAETVIISGLGGMLAIKILEEGKEVTATVKQLVLQPQQDICLVRQYVHGIGFKIEDEAMVYEEGIFYNILNCKRGVEEKYNEKEYLLGKKLIENNDKTFKKFLLVETEKIERLIKTLEKVSTNTAASRAKELQNKNKIYKEALLCL